MQITRTKTYVVDIDGTICSVVTDGDYRKAEPIKERIEMLNNLHSEGNTIIYFTARGMGRHLGDRFQAYNEFYDLTQRQLDKWGAKHHRLILGKPSGDIYIDDKGTNADDFFTDEIR
jgi:hypothetical protein